MKPKSHTPNTEKELAQLIADAQSPLRVEGTGTKSALGNAVNGTSLSLAKFSGVEIYEPEELIFEAGAAIELDAVEKLLAKHNQMLAFEPPDFRKLLAAKSGGTLGGLVSCGLSGPRRIKAGATRDHVLGARGVTGRGDIFKAGARVVKNVTGYDIPKLLTGSYGTLAALTSVTMKVLPRPETETTLVFSGLNDQDALRVLALALQSAADVSGAACVPGAAAYVRLEGIAASVAFRRNRLLELTGAKAEILAAKESANVWRGIRDVEPLASRKDDAIWRISVAPSHGAKIAQALSAKLDCRYYFDWAGGLIWMAVAASPDGGAAVIRAVVDGGHATLMRASSAVRAAVNAFHPQPPALAALTGRVKQSFDPRGILNPGRMYKGV